MIDTKILHFEKTNACPLSQQWTEQASWLELNNAWFGKMLLSEQKCSSKNMYLQRLNDKGIIFAVRFIW